MIIQLLDIAPWPSEAQRQAAIQAMETREAKQAQKRAEKQAKKAEKKAEKQMKKAEKSVNKQKKRIEKQAKKLEKQFSAAPTKTITTVQEGTENNGEMQYASMPIGLILAVSASLLICLASAWYYRRHSTKA